jgi:hypothetical protein
VRGSARQSGARLTFGKQCTNSDSMPDQRMKFRHKNIYEPSGERVYRGSPLDRYEVVIINWIPSFSVNSSKWEIPHSRMFEPVPEEGEVVIIRA